MVAPFYLAVYAFMGKLGTMNNCKPKIIQYETVPWGSLVMSMVSQWFL